MTGVPGYRRANVTQHGRIVDGVLRTSLEKSNRFDVIEGRLAALETQVQALRGLNS